MCAILRKNLPLQFFVKPDGSYIIWAKRENLLHCGVDLTHNFKAVNSAPKKHKRNNFRVSSELKFVNMKNFDIINFPVLHIIELQTQTYKFLETKTTSSIFIRGVALTEEQHSKF